MGNSSGSNGASWSPGQVKLTGQIGPRSSSLLAGAGIHRIGARAFSTLEGYAGRKRRNGVGFSWDYQENERPPSRFSSEIGTKADAKQ
jgi:hypothetical protein